MPIFDRIRDTSTTSGTALVATTTFTVAGSAPSGFQTFSARFAVNDANIPVVISHQAANEWQICWCTYTALNTLRVDTVLFSSSADAGVNFSAGTKDVFVSGSSRAFGAIREANTWTGNNTFPNTGLRINDTNASHVLTLAPGSDLTANRTLTITTGDADRTLNISAGSVTVSSYGATLVDDADAATARTTLGLGTAATVNTGTSGGTIPLLNAQNTWSANQILTKASAVLQMNSSSGDSNFYISSVAGSASTARWGHWTGSAFNDRWLFGKSADAESGSDAGSNFVIYNYTDAGAFKATFAVGIRSDNSFRIHGGLFGNGVTGGSKGANTANFGTLYEGGTALDAKYGRLGSTNTWTSSQTFSGGATITGGTIQSRPQASTETTGTLTSASANETIQATGNITINNSVFTAGDVIVIYAGASSRTLTQGAGVTMRLAGTATTGSRTLAAYGIATLFFVSASEVAVGGTGVT